MIRFINKETGQNREFINEFTPLNLEDELVSELLKPNYENQETKWVLAFDEEENKISEIAQVKINIKDIGYILVGFDIKTFNEKKKKKLFDELIGLKNVDINTSRNEFYRKILSVFLILEDFEPFYGLFVARTYFKELEEIVVRINKVAFPVFCIEDPIKEEVATPVVSDAAPAEAKKEEPREEEKRDESGAGGKEKFKHVLQLAKASAKTIWTSKFTHAFSALFFLLISLCSELFAIYFDNNSVGLGILFVVFVLLFIGLNSYNLSLFKKEREKIALFDYIYFGLIGLIGVVLGQVFGWLMASNMIKYEDKTINFSKNITIASIISVVLVVLFLVGFYLVDKYLLAIKKKFSNKDKEDKPE